MKTVFIANFSYQRLNREKKKERKYVYFPPLTKETKKRTVALLYKTKENKILNGVMRGRIFV